MKSGGQNLLEVGEAPVPSTRMPVANGWIDEAFVCELELGGVVEVSKLNGDHAVRDEVRVPRKDESARTLDLLIGPMTLEGLARLGHHRDAERPSNFEPALDLRRPAIPDKEPPAHQRRVGPRVEDVFNGGVQAPCDLQPRLCHGSLFRLA